jgi:hypothetical protein
VVEPPPLLRFQLAPIVGVVQPAELEQLEREVRWRDQEVVTVSDPSGVP